MKNWRNRKVKGALRHYSVAYKLRKENKTNDEFEVMLNNLTLEELISLKLELGAKMLEGRLYGLKIWSVIPSIARNAVLLYALSATKTLSEAASFLGVSLLRLEKLLFEYGIRDFFKDTKKIDK